jgi:Protein of unknown function (DUF2690)
MNKRRNLLLGLLIATAAISGPLPHAAASAPLCSGASCLGLQPSTEGCLTGSVEIQDQSVPGLGDVYLYESAACGAAWAQLNVSSTASAIAVGATQQISEIVYESPTGGLEQALGVYWDRSSSDVAYSPMAPVSDSIKACGGNPDSNEVFDIDPQGNQNLYLPGVYGGNGSQTSEIAFGACTLWH